MPDDFPHSSPEDLAAAIEAMWQHWERIEHDVETQREDEDEKEWDQRRTEMMAEFYTQHGATMDELKARGIEGFDEIVEGRDVFMKQLGEMQAAEERLLQAYANAGEAYGPLAEEALKMLERLENLPQERWDAMSEMSHKETYEMLEEFREKREMFLDVLPPERRKEWERRLGL